MPRSDPASPYVRARWSASAVAVALACLVACTPAASGTPTPTPTGSASVTASAASPASSDLASPSTGPSDVPTPSPAPTMTVPTASPSPTAVGHATTPPARPTPTPRPAALLCGLYKGPAVGPPPPASGDGVVRVFLECDMNKDGNPGGALDANEGPLPGVSVTMRCTSPGSLVQTHVTGTNGAATFTGLSGYQDCTMSAVKTGWFMSAMFPNLSLPPSWPGGVAPGVTYFDLFMAPS